MDKRCRECVDGGSDTVVCSAEGCHSYMCSDLSQGCACPCYKCKKVFCEDHVTDEHCECVVCMACAAERIHTCDDCLDIYSYFCNTCGDNKFMDQDMLESLEGWESVNKCMECFLDDVEMKNK